MMESPRLEGGDLKVFQLNGTYEAFGLVMDFLCQKPPFAAFEAKTLADAVQLQLRNGNHLIAMTNNRVVGYAGWLHTTRAIGEAWVSGQGSLTAVPSTEADAASLTIVASTEGAAIPRLIRGARTLNAGRRVYFKRDANSTQGARKRSVKIVSGPGVS